MVGFEIESGWRTRKHVKGDLLNLQDAGVALGVIVLAGDSDKDEGLRSFATQLVDRPGATMLIWTARDVRALAEEALSEAEEGAKAHSLARARVDMAASAGDLPDQSRAVAESNVSTLATVSHAGKYAALHRWLKTQDAESLHLSFSDIEEVLGFPLPSSCRQHVPHWHSYEGSAVARAVIDAGWKASRVCLTDETLTLRRLHD